MLLLHCISLTRLSDLCLQHCSSLCEWMGILHTVGLCRYISQVPELTQTPRFCLPQMYQGTEIDALILPSCCRGQNDIPDHHPEEVGREKLQFHPLTFTQDCDNGTATTTKQVVLPGLSLLWWRLVPDPISGVQQIKEKTRKSAGNFLEERASVWLGCG